MIDIAWKSNYAINCNRDNEELVPSMTWNEGWYNTLNDLSVSYEKELRGTETSSHYCILDGQRNYRYGKQNKVYINILADLFSLRSD